MSKSNAGRPHACQSYEIKRIGDLKKYDKNSRTHSREQIEQIKKSINEFGFTNPLLIDEESQIIAGHGRLEAARLAGLAEVPCVVLKGLNESQKRALVIADNQLALNAGWDLDLLKAEIEELKEVDFNIDLLGFDDDFIDGLLPVEINEGLTDEDEVPEVDDPISKRGDLWILGNHRLMCGDSTSIDDVERLINGEKIDLVHTDPPYGISESAKKRKSRETNSLSKANSHLHDFNDENTDAAKHAFALCESLRIKRQVWWGANYYAHAVPETANWFVWDKRVEDKQKDANSDCELAWVKSKWSSVRIFRHLWKGLIKGSEKGQARVHPTQKPVALVEWVIDYYSDVNTVLDLFGGSGSTLIACEKKNCRSFVMELEAHYVDVIINRWQNYTGKKAALESTGQTYDELKGECIDG